MKVIRVIEKLRGLRAAELEEAAVEETEHWRRIAPTTRSSAIVITETVRLMQMLMLHQH
jgi:hypothetical protein